MCGIAGFIADRHPDELSDRVQVMIDSLAHRGPDGVGLERWRGAALGHRRLAILDLSPGGHQPMLSNDRQIGVTFNGCIYNYLELKRDLEAEGFRFKSSCDTEVLLHGYIAWGISQLTRRLQGMFAFGIWDAAKQTLCLVRDRLGVKPLLFANLSGGDIAFASTAGALHGAGFADKIDLQAVLEVLEFGWPTDNRSIYQGVEKLPPGTILQWRRGQIQTETYWRADQVASRRVTFAQAVDETEALLIDAVRHRLIADVPVGALLSGGIDSALVCWALTRLNSNIKAFTVGTPGESSDETAAAVETARKLGIEHEVVQLSRDRPVSLNALTSAYSEPFACTSALGMLQVSAAVRPHAKVLLTGDGGDDFFLGYPYHQHMAFAQQIARSLPGFAAPMWKSVRPLVNAIAALRRPKHLMDYAIGGLGAVTQTHDGLPYFERTDLLGERLRDQTIASRRIALSSASARNVLNELVLYDINTVFRGEYLPKVDGTTLYCGIEARSPFLDYRMAELALSLPSDVRLHGGKLKSVLRELTRRHLGDEVANRPKRGFTIPVERWLAKRWRNSLEQLGPRSLIAEQGWIDGERLREVIASTTAQEYVPKQIWHLLVLEHWLAGASKTGDLAFASPSGAELV
jgi:asparagine synthase (glutamine-hydrolysing)